MAAHPAFGYVPAQNTITNSSLAPPSASGSDGYSQGSIPTVQQGPEVKQMWSAPVVTGQAPRQMSSSGGAMPEQSIFPGVVHARARRDSSITSTSAGPAPDGGTGIVEDGAVTATGEPLDRVEEIESNGVDQRFEEEEQDNRWDWDQVGRLEDDSDDH